MNLFVKLIVTFIAGITGAVISKKLKFVPAAYMLGSLIFVTALNLSTGFTYFPIWLRTVTQILAGTYLGLSITRENLYSIRTVLLPISLIMLLYVLFTLSCGYFMFKVCHVDLVTSLYCFAPGGISDIAIIADSVGGDVGMITFMQLVRLITVFIFYPFLYQVFEKKGIIKANRREQKKDANGKAVVDIDMTKKEKLKGMVISLAFTSVGGMLGYYFGVPAGAMVFAMASGVIINIIYRKTYMPIQMRLIAQIMSGIYLALRITPESIAQISQSLMPVAIMIISVITIPLVFGYFVHKLTKLELATALFACTPGGMSEMTLLADDMGLDFVTVSISHLARIIIIVTVFPQIINLFIRLVG